MKPAILISSTGRISAIINGKSIIVELDHPNYSKIINCIRNEDYNSVLELFDITSSVSKFVSQSGKVCVKDGQVFYLNRPVHNIIAERILSFIAEGLPFQPILNFLENLMANPSMRAVNELYTFLEYGNLPITEDGHFLAYKKVRDDYKDIYSGTFDNSVGSICEMPRNQVDEDKNMTCSSGLHFCSKEYLPHFGGEIGDGYRIVIVKINPRDVVSIPVDYNNTKGRTCRYEVIGELNKNEYLNSLLYSSKNEDACKKDKSDTFENSVMLDNNKTYAFKPSGKKFYNVRDKSGKFVRKS